MLLHVGYRHILALSRGALLWHRRPLLSLSIGELQYLSAGIAPEESWWVHQNLQSHSMQSAGIAACQNTAK